jgi:hypothetical protein
MRVSEAIALPFEDHRKPVELEGKLIVSSHLVCIVDDHSSLNTSLLPPGILINREAVQKLEEFDIPLLAGSSVSITGNITLKGTITHTGIALLPKYIPYVYEFSFSTERFERITVVNGDTFKNVYLIAPQDPSAKTIGAIRLLLYPHLTIMQVRSLLPSAADHLVAEHVRGEEIENLLRSISQAGCTWRTEECEIFWGRP